MADSAYIDTHRAFVQAFFARGTLTFETSKPIISSLFTIQEGREILENDITQDDLDTLISTANTALSPLDFEIRSTKEQTTSERIYALVNTSSDALTQLATTYTADEIAFVKRVLDYMFDEPNNKGKREGMCIHYNDARDLNEPGDQRREMQNGTQTVGKSRLTKNEAAGVMDRLVEEGWFEKSDSLYYRVGPRSLMELRGWLVEIYNDNEDEEDGGGQRKDKIKFCHACKEIVTVGQRCANRKCPCRLHDICIQNFFRIHRSQTCPLCNTEWDGKHFVGEKAITAVDAALRQKRRSDALGRNTISSEANGRE